ncbi:hypothetical protein NHQ30_003150 [Ciborinia camelliae]|nr:hypothetical protein NHQ30_003150 [Ciborinia camelliae]
MANMGKPAFGGGQSIPHSAGHSSTRAQDIPWTPCSAVSSFNLPAHYDSSLITPITMAPSPNIPSRPAPPVRDRDAKLSPSMDSPDYALFGGDADDFGSRPGAPPMKQKEPSSGNSKIPISEPSYPPSPTLFCAAPYYGSFGVSATPKSGRSAELTSPNMNTSPQNTASNSMSTDLQRSRHATPAQSPRSYRVNNPAPILIAPNPNTLRPATRHEEMPYRDGLPYGRHDSIHSMHSISTQIGPYNSAPQQYSEQPIAPLPSRRKRKTPPMQLDAGLVYSGEVNHEEQILMELSVEGGPWKDIAKQFNAATGKSMKVPALQMRKKRLCERLRVWTDCEERALTLAWEDYDKAKWEKIAEGMVRHGIPENEKWSKEAVQRKFNEMYPPDDRSYVPDYALSRHPEDIHFELKMEPRTPWPNHDERDSGIHSLTEDEEQTLVGDLRSRTGSNASSLHFQHEQHHQMIYAPQQHQQNHPEVWEGN